MPKRPFNPLDEVTMRLAERLMEEHLFPLMDEMFSKLYPLPNSRYPPKPKRKRLRMNPAYREEIRQHPPSSKTRPSENAREYRRARPTLYDTLQVSRFADRETIQAAWKSLSLRFHPDKNPGDRGAAERMVRINQAWQVLGDPQKRSAYDRTIGA